jgi:hypothetical protein
MKKMFLLFSHTLTKEQEVDAIQNLKVKEFIYLPKNLQKIWSNVPADIENVDEFLEPIKEFLKQNVKEKDFVLIQGDFGATCKMANFVKTLNATPIYATTIRDAKEELINGKIVKTSVFKHVMFRSF